MSIPTPSAIAGRLTQRKQHELQHEAEQKALAEKLDRRLSKDSDEKHKRTAQKNGWGQKKGSGSSGKPDSSASRSSRKGKGQGGSTTPQSSRRDTVRGTSSKSEQTAQTSTPTSSSMKQSTLPKKQENGTETVKKPFVRKPHLTQRLSDNEALRELQKSFPKTQHHNRSEKRTSRSSKRK